jgi:nitrogen regulatory protein PII
MVKLEVVVADQQKGDAIGAILRLGKTGKLGDGRIFVLPVDEAIRNRTEEHGVNAV